MSVDLAYNYKETTSNISGFSQNDIDKLREWTDNLDNSKYVPKDLSDKQLVLFYNACELDLDKTKICIEKYFSCKKNAPEFFTNRNVLASDIAESVETLEFSLLPEQSPEGYDIIYHGLHLYEPSKYHLDSGVKLLIMTADLCLYHRGPQKGVIFLFDMRGVKLTHLTRLSMSSLKKFFTYIQEAMPLRMKAIHIMNAIPLIDKILALLRPFMDRKLLDLIKIHTSSEDMEKFYKNVLPKSALPCIYGGDLPDTQDLHKKCMAELAVISDYFQKEEEQRKRALPEGKKEKNGHLETTFKKLDID